MFMRMPTLEFDEVHELAQPKVVEWDVHAACRTLGFKEARASFTPNRIIFCFNRKEERDKVAQQLKPKYGLSKKPLDP